MAMIAKVLMAPVHAAMLASSAKSFRDNSVIGSPWLNARGLHAGRIRLAERMADLRRRHISHLAEPGDAAAFARDGIVVKPDFLPESAFTRLRTALGSLPVKARDMRQGGTVTRFAEVGPALMAAVPDLDAFRRGGLFQNLLRYAAAADAEPLVYLHCVFADADSARHDPQTTLHSDTFHAAAKGWLFLDDVEDADGPFTYVPGSHRLTPGRIAWEREQSLTARAHPDRIHARGSFRASPEELAAMGYGPPVKVPVRANTLVVADTHGFHARARAARASVRPAIYGSLRRNPFLPWAGGDLFALPGLRGRKTVLFGGWQDFAETRLGLKSGQPAVGAVRLTAPPGSRADADTPA
jgi:hypothetical protein